MISYLPEGGKSLTTVEFLSRLAGARGMAGETRSRKNAAVDITDLDGETFVAHIVEEPRYRPARNSNVREDRVTLRIETSNYQRSRALSVLYEMKKGRRNRAAHVRRPGNRSGRLARASASTNEDGAPRLSGISPGPATGRSCTGSGGIAPPQSRKE